jgi:RNA polymerase sigma-70 factor (TIGR02960 family)
MSWLEPYPDFLLDEADPAEPGPEVRHEARESVSLAFLVALHLLPARQRAVLVLRDVLGYPAIEVAGMLDTSVESVKSALKRARSSVQRAQTQPTDEPPPAPGPPQEQDIVERFTNAYQAGDLHGVLALLTEDVSLTMPPLPFEYQGRIDAARLLDAVASAHAAESTSSLHASTGNPRLGSTSTTRAAGAARPIGLLVLTLAGSHIAAITNFEPDVLARFGLPRTLPT